MLLGFVLVGVDLFLISLGLVSSVFATPIGSSGF
jgi:hypothetical protein